MKNRARFISLLSSLVSLVFVFVYMLTDVFTAPLPYMFSLKGMFILICFLGVMMSVVSELMHPNSESDNQTQGVLRCISTVSFVVAIVLYLGHVDSWTPVPYTVPGVILAGSLASAAFNRVVAGVKDCIDMARELHELLPDMN